MSAIMTDYSASFSKRSNMKHLSNAEIAIIKARLLRGDKYAEIASDYRLNQGRLADLKYGRIYRDVPAADISDSSFRGRER